MKGCGVDAETFGELLIRSRVPAVLQQNMTIVQRASRFRSGSGGSLCLSGPGQGATALPPPVPCEQLGVEIAGSQSPGGVGGAFRASDLWHS